MKQGSAPDESAESLCSVLEEEAALLFGQSTAPGPRGSTPAERMAVLTHRLDGQEGDEVPTALCLSGGGIRSATFCLGAIQGLARVGVLRDFHYLSTVSGGGYIGGWLSSWIQREQGGLEGVINALKNGAEPAQTPMPERRKLRQWPVDRLRAYTNYLSPVWGLSTDALTLVATFLRNLVLNWVVMLPLMFAAVLLPRLQVAMLGLQEVGPPGIWAAVAAAVLLLTAAVAYIAADLPGPRRRWCEPPCDACDRQPEPINRFLWLCMVPLLGAALLLSWAGAWVGQAGMNVCADSGLRSIDLLERLGFAVAGAAIHVLGAVLGWLARDARGLEVRRATFPRIAYLTALFTGAIGGVGLSLFAEFSCEHADSLRREWRDAYAVLGVPALLALFWGTVTLHVGGSRRFTTEDDREWWSRAAAVSLGVTLGWTAFAFLVISAPGLLLSLTFLRGQIDSTAGTVGAGTAGLGVLISAFGYWSKRGAAIKADAETWATRLGVRMLDLASLAFTMLLVVAMSLAVSAVLLRAPAGLPADTYRLVLDTSTPGVLAAAVGVLILFGAVVTLFTGVNAFSLHNMYGNRLARAYLGATHRRRRAHWFTGFDPEDNVPMADLRPKQQRMLHVINVALNLAQPAGDRLEWQQRKAAPFTITPLHCGSPSLGYARTQAYGRKPRRDSGPPKTGGLTLGRAVAISGAAASPNMGYHTSKIVAFVMSFFNVRLGWWLPNTKPRFGHLWLSDEPRYGLGNVLKEALAGTSDDSSFVYLSDGGHFENLGLYEMVRRRCRRIVVVDASEDPDFLYEDLESSVRKIRIDLGIEVRFDDGLPSSALARKNGRHYAVGRVHYRQGVEGTIIYIKPVLSGDEPMDVQRYAAAALARRRSSSVFPHDPTSHQAFDEAQFESYRMLGLHSVLQTFKGRGAWDPKERPERWRPLVGPLGAAAGPQLAPVGAGGKAAANAKPVVVPIGNSWGAMATGAVLAGSIAVTGTVVLKDNTVTLKDNQLSVQMTLDPQQLQALQAIAVATIELAQQLKALGTINVSVSASAVAAAASASNIAVRDWERVDRELRALQARIDLIVLQPALPKELLDALVKTAASLESAANALRVPERPASSPVTARDVADALKALERIREAIRDSARRNVSGPTQ